MRRLWRTGRPTANPDADERGLYLGAREEEDLLPLGKDDPDAHNRRLHAQLFLLSVEKLWESLRAFVEETNFRLGELTLERSPGGQRGRKVGLREQDHISLALWAADCAEHVLSHFEKQCPEDGRPRKAIEAGRAWAREEIKVGEARTAAFAAHAAAREAEEDAARAAARATGHAAATAHVAAHAAAAADYAVKAVTHASADAAARERDWQYQSLPERLRPVAFPARNNS